MVDKDKPVILEQHSYIGVFGEEKRTVRDIVIMCENGKYEIELKFQTVPGSTDEKVIYAFNCMGISDCDVGIVCVDGKYWYEQEYRIKGLKKQADSDILSRFILNFDCVITWNLRSGLIINPLQFQLLKVY